jgi:hypothetical protein
MKALLMHGRGNSITTNLLYVSSVAISIHQDSTIFDACVKFLMQAAAVTLYVCVK